MRETRLDFLAWIRPYLRDVDEFISQSLRDDNPLTTEIATHLQQGGGKRLRPALVLLSGAAVSGKVLPELIPVGAAVEIIHMATLVHDDTIDKAMLRRGLPTVNKQWSDEVAILIGDFLFAKAFSLLAQHCGNRVVQIMADVVLRMSSGEIEQNAQAFNVSQSEHDYMLRIDKKTAYFIGECCRLGSVVSGGDEHTERLLRRFGFCIGISYQIIDDILDFGMDSEQIGKPIGNDLRSGVLTLPVLYALSQSPNRDRLTSMIRARPSTAAEIDEIRGVVVACGGLEYAEQVARRFTDEAMQNLNRLPEGSARQTLACMAEYLMQRNF